MRDNDNTSAATRSALESNHRSADKNKENGLTQYQRNATATNGDRERSLAGSSSKHSAAPDSSGASRVIIFF